MAHLSQIDALWDECGSAGSRPSQCGNRSTRSAGLLLRASHYRLPAITSSRSSLKSKTKKTLIRHPVALIAASAPLASPLSRQPKTGSMDTISDNVNTNLTN